MALDVTEPSTMTESAPPTIFDVQEVNVTYVNVNGATDDVPSPYER